MKHSRARSLPTCHHCDVTGHIRPHYPQIHSQKPRIKKQEPKKDKTGSKSFKPHHTPREKWKYLQWVAPLCHHYGKIGHKKANCFKLKPEKPKDNQLYERLISMMKNVLI
jgi:hypothetical protein